MNRPERKEVKTVILQLGKLGVSQEQVAVELKVSFTSVYNWVKEKSAPNWATYNVLLVLLHKAKKKRR